MLQESIIGPLMFLLYINDLPQYLKFTTPGLYADDTQIYASSDNYDELVNFLNSDLENISRWLFFQTTLIIASLLLLVSIHMYMTTYHHNF